MAVRTWFHCGLPIGELGNYYVCVLGTSASSAIQKGALWRCSTTASAGCRRRCANASLAIGGCPRADQLPVGIVVLGARPVDTAGTVSNHAAYDVLRSAECDLGERLQGGDVVARGWRLDCRPPLDCRRGCSWSAGYAAVERRECRAAGGNRGVPHVVLGMTRFFIQVPLLLEIVLLELFVFWRALEDGQFDDLDKPEPGILMNDNTLPEESPHG